MNRKLKTLLLVCMSVVLLLTPSFSAFATFEEVVTAEEALVGLDYVCPHPGDALWADHIGPLVCFPLTHTHHQWGMYYNIVCMACQTVLGGPYLDWLDPQEYHNFTMEAFPVCVDCGYRPAGKML